MLGRHVRRWITVTVIVAVIAGAGATAWAVTGRSGPGYRTATVVRGDITQTLVSTGTIEPVNEANVSFPVSGQVASVAVSLGSDVKAGQAIAQLSTTSLASQVSADQYTVATDTVRLATDQASETSSTSTASTTSSTGGSGSTSTSGGSSSGSTGSTGSGGSSTAIVKAQAAVLAAQKTLDADLAVAKPLMTDVTTLCGTTPTPTPSPTGTGTTPPSTSPTSHPSRTPSPRVVQNPSPTPSHSVTPRSSAPSSKPAASSPSVTPSVTVSARLAALITSPAKPPGGGPTSGPPPTTCQAAITQLLSAETSIASDEQSLASDESALSKLLSKASGSGSGSGSSGSGGSKSGASGSGSSGSGSSGSGSSGSGSSGSGGSGAGGSGSGGSSGPASAQQLAADQANLDAANAELGVARQNMAAATLVAPISGTIAQVNIGPGQQVTGSQGTGTSASFVIEGAGGQEATTTVSGTNVGQVRVGQPATVTLDGSANVITGEVVSVGILSSSSSTGSVSFPVTIGLTSRAPTLYAGSDAQVTITLAKVSNAVTVPTSAVTSLGAFDLVTVVEAGKPANVRVTVGATGPVLTQITSGLTVGQQVVLANLNTPLPTNSNPFATRGLTTGGGGGFGPVRAGTGGAGGRGGGG
jgi:HlyD family secretion protein